MGIRDRLDAAKRYLWSPVTVSLLGEGSDELVRAGSTARVIVVLEGENDGSCERVEVLLTLNYSTRTWSLGELPVTTGRHELEVEIPIEAPPSSPWTEYAFKGVVHRKKGTPSDRVSPVRVIGDPAHVFWPEGSRAGSDDAALAVTLDAETVNAGDAVSGRLIGTPGKAVSVSAGPVLDMVVHVEGRSNGVRKVDFKPVAEVAPDATGAFRIEIPVGAPPSLHDGANAYVWWEVRATGGDVTAWQRFALLDPEGLVEIRELKAAGLLDPFI